MGSVDLVKLDEPKFDKATWTKMMVVVNDIKKNGVENLKMIDATAYSNMKLPIGINTRLQKDEPAVVEFFSRYTLSSSEVSALLHHYLTEADGEAEMTARHFLKTNKAWDGWVPGDVAKKVRAAL